MRDAALAATILGIPLDCTQRILSDPPLPSAQLLSTSPDRYWAELRQQWVLAADHINLNCGSLGCTPLPVLSAMIQHVLCAEEFREIAYPWFGYEENARLCNLRESLASFLNVSREELALVRNTTEANNIVAHGVDLRPGEEVLLTDQEHPGGRCPWEQRAARFGVKLNYVAIPDTSSTAQEILDRFESALTPQTRLVFFSHITTTNGLILPAKQICAMLRSRGVLSQVDGAHGLGQIPVDLRDIGCDFYSSSSHKWLMAPKGSGILFVREEQLKNLWVNTASANWRNYDLKAYRFSCIGTSNLSVMVGFKAALDFHLQLGPNIVYTRIHELASELRERIARFPQLRITNAGFRSSYGGMISFVPNNEEWKGDLTRLMDLCESRKIRFKGTPGHFRLSTHIFTQPSDLDVFCSVLRIALS